ncbi:MAG: cell division protein ZapA [Bacteroidia bacterium]|nr:cell division protein ZapA [Bacteroidia bacterium]
MPPVQKQVNIGNRSYPLTIDSSEEQKVKSAQSLIDEKLFVYEGRYPGRDYQDLLAMTSLQLALEMQYTGNGKKETESNQQVANTEAIDLLKKLDQKLSQALAS